MSVNMKEVLSFLKYLRTLVDIADPEQWKPEELEVLKEYQSLAPQFFNDLKADHCLSFDNVSPTQSLEDLDKLCQQDDNLARFTRITSNIANSLPKSSNIFRAEEQWVIFLSPYVFQCEQIKSLFEDSIRKINKRLSPQKRKRLRGFVTLNPMMDTLREYRRGKYAPLFTEIDSDLRNAIAHFSFEFLNDEIKYGTNRKISTLELLFKYRKISALRAILFGNKVKTFAPEFESLARKMGVNI